MKHPKKKTKAKVPKLLDKTTKTVDQSKTIANKINEHMPDTDNESAERYATDNTTNIALYAGEKAKQTISINHKDVINNQARYSRDNHIQSKHDKSAQVKEINDNHSIREVDAKGRPIKTKANTNKYSPKSKSKANAISTSKKARKAIKQAKKSVKTVKQSEKAIRKTANSSTMLAKQMAIRAKQAAKDAYKVGKGLFLAIKVMVRAVKSLVSLIIAGGWVSVVIIILIVVVAYIVSSPWGMFFDDGDDTTMSVSECIVQIEADYNNRITGIIRDAGEVKEIIYEGDSDTGMVRPINWVDVLGIFSVKVTADEDNPMDVMIMDDIKFQMLEDIFWNMNSISYEIEETEIEPTVTPVPTYTPYPTLVPSPTPYPSYTPTPNPTPIIERTLIITTSSKTYEEGIELYNFSEAKIALLDELMSPECYPLFMELCGMDSFSGLTPEQMNQLINDLPAGTRGGDIVRYALSRLGHPYSQAKRGQGDFVDCSYLTRWCYNQAGVAHFTAGTAAEQTRYCIDNGFTIAYFALQPGDLIFWSFNINGRFMNVTHTGIYAGDGMVIDASATRGMVVYRPIFGIVNIVACARPHVR